MTSELPALSVDVLTSVSDVGRQAWDAVAVGRQAIPFLHWGFLSALEESGSLGPRTGWTTTHLAARARADGGGQGGQAGQGPLLGLAPAFIKAHSLGEFVYDWAWAEAAERMGTRYYPKLVLAAPFSPVMGERLLVAPAVEQEHGPAAANVVRRALLARAIEVARGLRCSGVHLLFCSEAELKIAQELGFTHRLGCQFHWDNVAYADFDAFLARFDSKRRNQIRRERRRVSEQGVTVTSLVGDAVTDELIGPAYEFYEATIARFAWGRRYLNRTFFELLWQRMRPYLQVMIARRGDAIVGGSLNLESLPAGTPGAIRFGRYWGALDEVDSLHFEVCAYAAIEDCIKRGVVGFEAGAGGEEHKLGRGFLPHRTHSAHLLFEPRLHAAIADFCGREAAHIESSIAATQVFVR